MATALASFRGPSTAALARSVTEALRQLKGQPVEVVVRKPTSKRSLDQNAYLHAEPFRMLAEELGDSVEGIKYDLMGEKWGWKPSPLDPSRLVPVQPSTSAMTVEECTAFIEWLIPFAAQKFGVLIPYPSEWEDA